MYQQMNCVLFFLIIKFLVFDTNIFSPINVVDSIIYYLVVMQSKLLNCNLFGIYLWSLFWAGFSQICYTAIANLNHQAQLNSEVRSMFSRDRVRLVTAAQGGYRTQAFFIIITKHSLLKVKWKSIIVVLEKL